MSDTGGDYADETVEMVSDNVANASVELRKRRSTRIVQAVPLMVTGVDALGRPFVERTSSLIINCHGCRYQSKHYVLKNMWVTLEIPHPEAGQPPRSVRGRVVWIQRPRTVRQLFQIALELEVCGNVWGVAFPPEDWFSFAEDAAALANVDAGQETTQLPSPAPEMDSPAPVSEVEPATSEADNLRMFPSPASATDASLQLARQVARLVADAKQQIQAATREAAAQAVSAERQLSFEQWEQKFAAGRAEIANEAARAIEKFQQEADVHSQAAHAAAAESLRAELPRWLAPQFEQLTHELTDRLMREAVTQRNEQSQQLESMTDALRKAGEHAEYLETRLKTQTELAQSQIAEAAQTATRLLEETARQRQEATASQREAFGAAANEIQQQVTATLSAAQSLWQGQIGNEVEAAQARLRETIENTLAEAQDRGAGGLNEHALGLIAQLREEQVRHSAAMQQSAEGAAAELQQRAAERREALEEQLRQLESALGRAQEASKLLERHSAQLENAQQQALAGFHAQIESALNPHREEVQRRSEAIFEEIHARIRTQFEEASREAASRFDQQIEQMVQPHVTQTEEAIHRLAGGRSLLDAALTLQQERIRNAADEAFAESLARFRENLGTVEQVLQESSQKITLESLTELEGKVSDLKHQMIEELFKSAEWYEKKAQTQIQHLAETAVEHSGNQLREKAGEISGVFASELDHSSRSFVGHTQTQMEEVVRDSFERARALFAEAADTTAAAFTDEIQRTGRQELGGYDQELRRSTEQARMTLDAEHAQLAQRITTEQEGFLRRFETAMAGALEAGVAQARKQVSEGFGPLLDSWKSMVDAYRKETRDLYTQLGEQAAEQHRNRLENVSNQFMLATVASLDRQSRDLIAAIAAAAEEKIREACGQVFSGVGESLRERLKEITQGFTPPGEPPIRAKSANTGA